MKPRHFPSLAAAVLAAALTGCGPRPAESPAPAGSDSREPDEMVEKEALLAEAGIAHVVVPEAFLTAKTPDENVDSPVSWRAPDNTRWLIATAKATDRLLVYDGRTGELIRTASGKGSELGRMDRPNGISVIDDLVMVVERDNHRVQVFQLPELKPLLVFGADELRQPYGLWVRARDSGYEVIVSDNFMSAENEDLPPPLPQLGERFKRYQLAEDAQGWKARLVEKFGDTSQAGAIRIAESVFGDIENDRLLLAEEDVAVGTRLREYGLDGKYRGRDIGTGLFKAQAEGMALAKCVGGGGYWIATDQFKDRSLFHVFDRRTLAHLGAFAGNSTANTDGVWLDQGNDDRFPQGVFYAVDDDQAVAAFDLRDIQKALKLPACRAP